MILKDNNPTNVYINFNAFLEDRSKNDIESPGLQYRDTTGMLYLKNALGLKYFTTDPVGILDGVTYVCKTSVSDSMEDMIDGFKALQNEGKIIILNDLIYTPQVPVYTKLDPQTFEPIPLEVMHMSTSGWKIRYAILGEEQ